MSVREITAREASHVDTANNWIDSDIITISIRDLREAIEKAKELGHQEGQDDKPFSCDCDDERYDEGFDDGYNKAVREQQEKEAANG